MRESRNSLRNMEAREKKIRDITFLGIIINIFLVGLKIITGLLVRSTALIADGIHSFSDLATDIIVLAGARVSHRPPDETHPYGHKKFETIASQLIAFALIGVSFGLIFSAGISIYRGKVSYPGFFMLVVALISVILKEILFFKTRRISRQIQSASLYANAWHHRSDSFSSIAVLIGGVASLLGWGHADHMATIVVGLMVMGVGGKIFYETLIELTEHSADRESIEIIERVLAEEIGVSNWHALRTRKLGGELFVDVHVLVEPTLSVLKSHKISVTIEEKIRKRLKRPVNILIHIEPA